MTVESATYIGSLNSALPSGSDAKAEGDDHIRLVKSTLLTTFPGMTGAMTATHTQLNKLVSTFSISSAPSGALAIDSSGNAGLGSSPLFTAANRGSFSVNGAASAVLGLGVAGVAAGSVYCDSGILVIAHSTAAASIGMQTTAPSMPVDKLLAFSLPSNTMLLISVRGADGVTRTASVPLS